MTCSYGATSQNTDMICAIIPTLNSGDALSPLLAALAPHCTRIIVSDGGSSNSTIPIAAKGGAILCSGSKGRGTQLARGADWADLIADDADWFLFLHSDVTLSPDWFSAVLDHIQNRPHKVGYFRFGADTPKLWGRLMEFLVGLRSFWWRLPYGDQGLLISRKLYKDIGGYPDVPLFEDIGLLDKIYKKLGRYGFRVLNSKLITDVSAYERDGWRQRTSRNFRLLKAYRRGVPIETLLKDYT